MRHAPRIRRTLAGLTALLALGIAVPPMARATEEPKYSVVQRLDGVEIRDYAPRIAATVVVPGPADEAGNQGFRILAAYIFGKNQGARTIEMTAPVAQQPASQASAPQKIEMTAPVAQQPAGGGFAVQFMMPERFTLETLPAPLDPRIRFEAIPRGRYAVIRYAGFWSDANYREHLERLRQVVEAAGLRATGEPIYARYDPPWVPWFMRRNEIWLRLA